jgi:hypothetical protein
MRGEMSTNNFYLRRASRLIGGSGLIKMGTPREKASRGLKQSILRGRR